MKYFLICIIALFTLIPSPVKSAEGDYIVLLHGIARTSDSMSGLEKYFSEKGYKVHNIDYPSREKTIEELAEFIDSEIRKFNNDKQKKLNFVTHSMGGIVARTYIANHRPENLGKVVMLGPPNGGSEVADFLRFNSAYKKIYGPAGKELVTGNSGIADDLPPVDFELGIIAGDLSIDPVSSAIIPGPDDGKVAIEKTKIEGMEDHIVMHVSHAFIMNDSDVMEQTWYFIIHGQFKKESGKD